MTQRFLQQIEFIKEVDKLKEIVRQNYICSGERRENDAEHMWHIALMSVVLGEYAPPGTNLPRVTQMLLAHDLIEVYAGDTYCYDEKSNQDKEVRERQGAEKLFALLPSEQGEYWMALWREFEECETQESVFANTMDRLQPTILNFTSQGKSWKEHGIGKQQVLSRNQLVVNSEGPFGEYLKDTCEKAVKMGYLKP